MSRPRIVFLDAGTIREDIQWPDFSSLGDMVMYDQTLPHETLERVRDAEIILTNKVLITAEHINAAPKLRYIGLPATGYNVVDCAAAAARGIPVCNVPNYGAEAVSQHAFALMIALQSTSAGSPSPCATATGPKARTFATGTSPLSACTAKPWA